MSGSFKVFVSWLKQTHLGIKHFNVRLKIAKTPEENKEEKLHGICWEKSLFSESLKCKQQKKSVIKAWY